MKNGNTIINKAKKLRPYYSQKKKSSSSKQMKKTPLQLNHEEIPKTPDCSKLNETIKSLESELTDANKTIGQKNVEITKLKTEKTNLINEVSECYSKFGNFEATRISDEIKKIPLKKKRTQKSSSPDETDSESLDFRPVSIPDYNKQLIDAVNNADVDKVRKISEDKTAIANLSDDELRKLQNIILSKIVQFSKTKESANILKYSEISKHFSNILIRRTNTQWSKEFKNSISTSPERIQKKSNGGKTKKIKCNRFKRFSKKRT